jgi:hypothetical protein
MSSSRGGTPPRSPPSPVERVIARSAPSIPSTRAERVPYVNPTPDGFGSATPRRASHGDPTMDVPGPGEYAGISAGTMSKRSGEGCGVKGFGNGFTSGARRISTQRPDEYFRTPGVGSYDVARSSVAPSTPRRAGGGYRKRAATSSFATATATAPPRTGYARASAREKPEPRTRPAPARERDRTAAFKDRASRFGGGRAAADAASTPGPDAYDTAVSAFTPRGVGGNDAAAAAAAAAAATTTTTRARNLNRVVAAALGADADADAPTPGPGQYAPKPGAIDVADPSGGRANRDRCYYPGWGPLRPERASTSPTPPTPGPGHYAPTTASRRAAFRSPFASETDRIARSDVDDVVGPAYYSPAVVPKRTEFHVTNIEGAFVV